MSGPGVQGLVPQGQRIKVYEQDFFYHDLGSGDPVVFLHGGGPGCCAWSDFAAVAPLFAQSRRVILVDLLQYGQSSMPKIHDPVWSYHARHVVGLLNELGIEQADFVCNSWGGSIALCTAGEYPDRVRKLVITGSMPVLRGPISPLPERGSRGRVARDRYYGGEGPTREKMLELMASLEWYDRSKIPEKTVTLRYQQSIDPDEVALGNSQVDRGTPQDLEGMLKTLPGPVLFMWGMYDAFLTPDYPLMLANLVPQGNLYVMDHVSHHLQEERPKAYASIVSAFLDQPCRDDEDQS